MDLEFERVLAEREHYISELRPDEVSGPLNVDLLKAILDQLLPPNNTRGEVESYSELLEDLKEFEIDDSKKIRELIKKHLQAAQERDAAIVARQRKELEETGTVFDTTEDRIQRGVFFDLVGLVREMLASEFGSRWLSYLSTRLEDLLRAEVARLSKSTTAAHISARETENPQEAY